MPTPVTTSGPVSLLTRMSRAVYRSLDERTLGVPLKTFHMLNQLDFHGETGLPQGELCVTMHMHPNNVVLLLNDAEADGLVERRRDPTDRRRHIVHITDAGRAAVARGEEGMDAIEDSVLASLSRAKRRQLRELLDEALAAHPDA